MTFDEYQKQARKTAILRSDKQLDMTICALGTVGEAGEVADKWKKILVYQNGLIKDEDRTELAKEMGDVIWYIAMFADHLGLSFDAIATQNIEKLASRKARDTLRGKGDNR